MRICGIVAEYNPFHNGHLYQIQRAKREIQDDCAVVCCMSGDFVQRGGAAVLPKHLRAEAAVLSGVDLVLELPVSYALSSAEGFASAAVHILSSLNVLTDLSFGAECDDASLLRETAGILLEQQTILNTLAHMQSGISYAAARERALFQRLSERSDIISKPNNILAIEYTKALIAQGSDIAIHPILRLGAEHDGEQSDGGFASASLLRRMMSGKLSDCRDFMPEQAFHILHSAMSDGRALIDLSRLECLMLGALTRLDIPAIAKLPGSAEGLEYRLYRAIRTGRSFDAICQEARTKRYPLARIRRMLFAGCLGITADDSASPPPYARVLALNSRGREILAAARRVTSIPIISKPAHIQKLSRRANALFEKEAFASDLYNLALPAYAEYNCGADWQENPVYVK